MESDQLALHVYVLRVGALFVEIRDGMANFNIGLFPDITILSLTIVCRTIPIWRLSVADVRRALMWSLARSEWNTNKVMIRSVIMQLLAFQKAEQ